MFLKRMLVDFVIFYSNCSHEHFEDTGVDFINNLKEIKLILADTYLIIKMRGEN